MPNLFPFQCSCARNWRFGVLAILSCLFFVRLGFWQLSRAEEKTQMIASQQRLAQELPINWPKEGPLPSQYERIKVQGTLMQVSLLLDNQFYRHQFGYDVLTPLLLANGKVVIVDRGWIEGDPSREKEIVVSVPKGEVEFRGSVYFPSAKNWVIGQIFDKKTASTVVIELFDAHLLTQFLHKSVYPFIIRLNPEAPHGFVRQWQVVSMPPQRHVAYAVQWFALAALGLILFVVLNMKKKR